MDNFNALIQNYFDKDVTVKSVIDGKQSETTNSWYFIIELSDNSIYQFSYSDHEAGNHTEELFDLNDDVIDVDDLNEELSNVTTDNSSIDYDIDEFGYFGFTEAKKYDDVDFDNKLSIDRALANLSYVADDAKLSHDNKVLTVTYDDGEKAVYVNYNPLFVNDYEDAEVEIAKIKALKEDRSIDNIRKTYFTQDIDWKKADKAIYENEWLETVNGNNYVINLDSLHM